MGVVQQLLRDPGVVPTSDGIAEGLGAANDAYRNFLVRLEEQGVTLMDWRYYNDGKAWLSKGEYAWTTARGTNKVKPLFWLSIWEGFFKVSFNFSIKVQDELLALPISPETKEIIAHVDAKGKTMKFIPVIFDVDDDGQLDDVLVMMQFRKEKA